MAKTWFGPVLCESGCCYEPPPPPPPPPCACDDTACFPVDELNFSSVKLQVELDNGWSSLGYVKELECNAGCKNAYQVTEHERSYTGFSAFNGTYDIPYYVYDDYTESWIEGDPLAIPCGVWFYPTISATITGTYTRRKYSVPGDPYAVYDSSACVTSTTTTTETRVFYLETRSGLMWAENYISTNAFPCNTYGKGDFWGGDTAQLWPPLSPSVLQRQIDGSVFACSTYGEPAINESYNVDGTRPDEGSPLQYIPPIAFGMGNNFGQSRAIGVGYDLAKTIATEPRQSTGYPWGDYPYGGPGIPVSSTQCKLDIEEYEDQIPATSTDIVNSFDLSGPFVKCNPFWPFVVPKYIAGTLRPDIWHFEHTAFRQYFKSIINAP